MDFLGRKRGAMKGEKRIELEKREVLVQSFEGHSRRGEVVEKKVWKQRGKKVFAGAG